MWFIGMSPLGSKVSIAYIPYLRLPDPTVERAQGFLIPIVALTSNLGIGIKLPYFIPLGEVVIFY